MIFTELMLNEYAKPLSETENQQCKNAIRMVGDALKGLGMVDDGDIHQLHNEDGAYTLRMKSIQNNREIRLLVQGSYANNTNVRTQSDVDIAVIQEDVFRTEYRSASSSFPQSNADYGFISSDYLSETFKDEVQKCLENKFGTDVERKNKSIKVHGNTYRKDADTVPCRRYRDYRRDFDKNPGNYIGGIFIVSDTGESIINYPEQHILNGRIKNVSTHQYYKKMVRIMKKMRYLMEDSSCAKYIKAAQGVSSFMLESLLWNIEDGWYLSNCGKFRNVYTFKLMITKLKESKYQFLQYKEANGIKMLCADNDSYMKLCAFLDELECFYDYV